MKALAWWFRIVGSFYLLLALMNLYFLFLPGGAEMIRGTIPFEADDLVVRAFQNAWSPFAFEILGLATFMLWASRTPLKWVATVWLIVWLEFWHGIVDDIYLIANGYDAVSYIAFIAIHIAVIVTGVYAARRALAEAGR